MRHKKWMISAILIMVIALFTLAFFQYREVPGIECHANVRVFKDNVELKVLFSYSMKAGSGVANVSGSLMTEGKITGRISRVTTFSYVQKGKVYSLQSNNAVKSNLDTLDNAFLGQYLPAFYLENAAHLILTIVPQNNSGWVFSTGKVPSFFCEKSHKS